MRTGSSSMSELIDRIDIPEQDRAAYKVHARRGEAIAEAIVACVAGIERLSSKMTSPRVADRVPVTMARRLRD